ncbi:hypothetical protein GCM10023238_40000 [Streptomyces heliomycini]
MAYGVRPAHRRALDAVGALELLRHEGREYATTPERSAPPATTWNATASCGRRSPRVAVPAPTGRRRDPHPPPLPGSAHHAERTVPFGAPMTSALSALPHDTCSLPTGPGAVRLARETAERALA